MNESVAWPPALAGTPAIAVLERALERDRLAHSLLLQGDDLDTLEAIALAVADRLLNPRDTASAYRPAAASGSHPDLFFLRPAGKMRQISADATRDLIRQVQVTPAIGTRKVAIIHEADRMNLQAANIFLKTLEEPPAHTTLLLLSTRPYALLPTIRSRVLHFRFPLPASAPEAEGWDRWIADYQDWLGRVAAGKFDRAAVADCIMGLYGLIARFDVILDAATAHQWDEQKEALSPELEDDERTAIETGIARGLRARLFAEIARATRSFALPSLTGTDRATTSAAAQGLAAAVAALEDDRRLLELNLNPSAALEHFLLTSLRIWARAQTG